MENTKHPYVEHYRKRIATFEENIGSIEGMARIKEDLSPGSYYPFLTGAYSANCEMLLREMRHMLNRMEELEGSLDRLRNNFLKPLNHE